MGTATVTLHRDPRCRGSIGGRYYATADGTRWLIDGESGCWLVGADVDSFTTEQCVEYVAGRGDHRSWVCSSLAEVRQVLAGIA